MKIDTKHLHHWMNAIRISNNPMRTLDAFWSGQIRSKEWLINETEKFCKDKAVYNAIVQSIQIIDGKDKKLTSEAIPEILKDALSISFDNSVGHDYLMDTDERFEFYHKEEERLPFDLDMFNKITKGGLPKKTLNIDLIVTVRYNPIIANLFKYKILSKFRSSNLGEFEGTILDVNQDGKLVIDYNNEILHFDLKEIQFL